MHEGQHTGCPQCFRIKLRTIRFHGIEAQQRRTQDKTFDSDMAAYKRMRGHGIQPQHIAGAAEIEAQANTSWEAEHNLIMSDPVRKEFMGRIQDAEALK